MKISITHKPFREFAMNRLLRIGSVALLACVLILGSSVASSQTIQRLISYQGLLTQPNGLPIVDGSYGLVLRFYDAPTGGNLVYEEQQQTSVTSGLFNVLIGSDVSLAGVNFEQQLWLETAIVGQTPFLPRTRLAVVPYAIRAENATVADSLGEDASGFVRSLNGGQGDLTIKGEDGITVTRDGDTIRIAATIVGGGSIEELTSQDATIDVTNPNGPITDIGLADGAVTNDKLADDAVNSMKIENGTVTLEDLEPGIIPTTLPPSGPAGGDLTGTYPDPLIRTDAVTSDKILNGQVKNEDLDNNSVSTLKLVDGAVTTPKLGNASVTNQKLADNSVSTSKLIDESVTTQKLSKTGVVPGVYGSSLLVPRFQVDDRGRLISVEQVSIPDIPFTGPAGGDLTGTYPNPQIKPLVINNGKLANDAVDGRVLQNNSVTGNKIVDGTIELVDIAPGVIPTTLPPSGPAGGVLAGTYPNPSINDAEGQQLLGAINNSATGTINDDLLNTTGVAAGSYGDGANGLVPRVTVDQYGRITAAVEQQILSATPTGNAGGDLQGTYPDPLINPTAAAGDRIVTAIRTSYLGGNTEINTRNNVVVLDGSNRLPAADGSLITNLDAGAITEGVLPIERGGTNSSTSLQNNRIMISSGGKIVESAPIAAQQILIGTGPTTLPTPGTITAGPGIDVSFSAPNFVINNTNPKLLPGTDDDQTLRWDNTFNQWMPNDQLLATAAGNVHAKGNVEIDGTLDVFGSTSVGIKDNSINRMGSGLNTTNSIGRDGATNFIYGETFINDNTDDNTSIGNLSSTNSSTTINVGSNGNLQLNGIDDEEPFKFLALNTNNDVRTALASGLALEGIMWQDGAFRLGGTDGTINPLLQDRYINVDNNSLFFTRLGGASNMLQIDGGTNTFTVEATTNINTLGTTLTTIGNPGSRTTIGGQLDPRGDITNDVGNVVIRDQTEIIGPTFINIGTDDNVFIGQQAGTNDQSITLSVGQGANGYLYAYNIKEDPTPLYMMTQDAQERVRKKLLADMADEGIQYQDGAFRLGTGESTPDYLKEKSYDENRYVNLDEFSINYTNGSEGVDGTTFVQFDGFSGGGTLVTITSESNINTAGSGNTNIGNAASTTTVLGPTLVNANGTDATQIGNGIGAAANVGIGEAAVGTHLLSINGTPQTNASVTPNILIDHLGGQAFNGAPYVDDPDNGVITSNVDGELFKWDENTFLNPFAWRVIGNTHPVVDGTNNLMGITNSTENIHFVTGGNATTNYALTIGADRRLGIGTEGATTEDYQVDIENASATNGVNVNVSGAGGVGVNVDAQDAGVVIGTNTTPIVGTQIDAQGVGVLIGVSAPPPAVGVSMDGNNTGILIENATTSIDAEGETFLNDDYNADNNLNTGSSTGRTFIGGGASTGSNRLTVNNTINLIGSSDGTNNRPAYRINGNDFLWEGAGGANNTLVGNTGNTTMGTGPNGFANVAVGFNAMRNAVSMYQSVAVGDNAAFNTDAPHLVVIGSRAGQVAGARTVIIGNLAGETASGGENVMVGGFAGQNAAGGRTVLVGLSAGRNSTGGNNTIIGALAGQDVGANNVIIGYSTASTSFPGASNRLLIDNSDTPTPLIEGDFAADQLTLNVATTAASLLVPGTAQTATTNAPNVRLGHLAGPTFEPVGGYTDDGTNGIVIADASGDLVKWDEAQVVGSVAWLLDGNDNPTNNILGTLSATDIDIRTNNVNHLTITSAGALTQGASAGQVTLTGNVDAQNGLDVTGADLTVGGTNFVVDDATGNTGIGENFDAAFALTVAGNPNDENVRMRTLGGALSTDALGDRADDGIIVADGNGVLRKVALPGSVFFGRVASDQNGAGGAAATVSGLSATVSNPGLFEVEVYIQYSGALAFQSFDVSINGSGGAAFTSISYGVVSSGQAIAPSNVDGAGTAIAGIGVDAVPANRQTILVKGFIDLSNAGTIDVQTANDTGIIYHANSYIKLTRLQ